MTEPSFSPSFPRMATSGATGSSAQLCSVPVPSRTPSSAARGVSVGGHPTRKEVTKWPRSYRDLNFSHLSGHAWSCAAMLGLVALTESQQQQLLMLLFSPKKCYLIEKGSLPDHFLQLAPITRNFVGTEYQITVQGQTRSWHFIHIVCQQNVLDTVKTKNHF